MGYPSLALIILVVFKSVGKSWPQTCPKFSVTEHDVDSYNCSESCLASAEVPAQENKKWPVFGTEYYHEDSDVCLAALHAGALSARGGTVTFSRDTASHVIKGTVKHRLVSQSKKQEHPGGQFTYKFLNITPVISQQDLAEDVVLVHNSYSGNNGHLNLTCLAPDINTTLTKEDITSWKYSKTNFNKQIFDEVVTANGKCVFPFNYEGKEHWSCIPGKSGSPWCGTDPHHEPGFNSYWDRCLSNTGRRGINMNRLRGKNLRAIRCLGRTSATDVLAVIQAPHQLYVSNTSSVRASLGEHLKVPINKTKKNLPDQVFLRRLPDRWAYKDGNTGDVSLPLTFDRVTPGDAGIYILGNDGTSSEPKPFKLAKTKVENNGAYFHLIVRECETGRYGPQCQSWCPDCENGGICHAVTGSCICAPGYNSATCQHACPRGSFGSHCQFTCQKATLGFSPAIEGQCRGLTLCLPEPYGCSCAPGYTGPFCDNECPAGKYGAGCSQDCDYCQDNLCDSVNGACTRHCIRQEECRGGIPRDLPRLRTPPSLTDIQDTSLAINFSSWTREDDDGSEEFGIVSYLVQLQEERNLTWTTLKTVLPSPVSSQTQVRAEHLRPGHQYGVRVLVDTTLGAAGDSTRKRVHVVKFLTLCSAPRLGSLHVLTVTNQSAVVCWSEAAGNHERCGIQYEVLLTSTTLPDGVSYHSTTPGPLLVSGLVPETHYDVTITATHNGTQVATSSPHLISTLPNAPSRPDVSVAASGVGRLSVSWTLPQGSSRADYSNLTYTLLQYKACGSQDERQQQFNISTEDNITEVRQAQLNISTEDNIEVEGLESYAEYEVCVTAENRGGTSPPACIVALTSPSDPSVSVSKFSCQESNVTTCTADLTGCSTYNGPNIHFNVSLVTNLRCLDKTQEIHVAPNISESKLVAVFGELLGGLTYEATIFASNNVNTIMADNTTFTTAQQPPPPVRNLTAKVLSSTKIRLVWNDPCPALGVITGFIYKEAFQQNCTFLNTTLCGGGYTRCVDVEGLTAHTNYTFLVSGMSSAGEGQSADVWVVTKEAEPGQPEQLAALPGKDCLDLQLWLPETPGGILLNFTIELKDKENALHNCSKSLNTQPPQHVTCQISGLRRGTRYKAKAFFCNSVGCGGPLKTTLATLPVPPKLVGKLRVKSKTNTTVTLGLPTLVMDGDGDRSLAILVTGFPKDRQDVTENYTAIYMALAADRINQSTRTASGEKRVKRQAGERLCQDTKRTYIAAVLSQDVEEFVVGERTSGHDSNCPLTTGRPYMVAVVAHVRLQENSEYAEMKINAAVVPEWENHVLRIVFSVLGLLLLFTFIITIIMFLRCRRTQHRETVAKYCKDSHRTEVYDNGTAAQNLSSHNVHLAISATPAATATPESQPCTPSYQRRAPPAADCAPPAADRTPPAADRAPPAADRAPHLPLNTFPAAGEEENINENIEERERDEDIYCNLTRRVAEDDVEAYLNKSIAAHDTMEDFMSVPSNVGKSMSAGEHINNKKKNRYRNNLPYDETRVKLSVINNDAFSDYINANHVYGFGGVVRYIAAQGPKETNVSTIADFWRMVREQHISLIIMVANFEESGKNKVGKYVDFEGTLEVDDYTVEVVRIDYHSNYNVSSVQVWKNGVVHTISHYHYTSWPDHGVPPEAHSLGAMLRQVTHTHSEGGVVVHCSAGIGRTGTVLLVLLLHEMLMVQGSVDPLEVLQRLRDCRARLVENTAQYNLGLKIFDELLYGANTVIPSVSVQDQMKEFMKTSEALYQKVLALPSGLTFRVLSQAGYYHLNRNPTIVPADTRRIFLEMEGGEMLSQYINAVRLDGLDEPNAMIVTEHPLPSTLNKFWKLVVEKKCQSLILINTFDGYEEEFPSVLPGSDCALQVGRYTLRTLHVAQYTSFDLYSVEVFSQQNVEQSVSVYQVTSWPYGTQAPPSAHVLVAVSEMLLQSPRAPHAGPLLLSCGDGVTGCGLLAGVLLTIENIQKYGKIDVYRTVVSLRRARPQFFVSQAQFDLLYSAALIYLENYDTYVNFPI